MKKTTGIWLASLAIGFFSTAAGAQTTFFQKKDGNIETPAGKGAIYKCSGRVTRVVDVGNEGLHKTSAVFGTTPGGGEGGQFDKVPLLTTTITLQKGQCLNAHFDAMTGSQGFYGVSSVTLFQVSLTPAGGTPVHMFGHYETPYGCFGLAPICPAVALSAEPDVDTLGANFFEHVGTGKHDILPGTYTVNVWWAGAPGGGGAIGAPFVLKLYTSQ